MILPESVTVAARSAGEAANVADSGEPRFILGMSDEQYHARPELSASGMKVLLRSPKAFQMAPPKESRALNFGAGVHERVLGVGRQPVAIPRELLSADGGVRSNAAKAWKADAEAAGKMPLKPDEYATAVRVSDAVLLHPKAGPLFERAAGSPEVSMFAKLPSGIGLRGRADWMNPEIVDLKTTFDLSPRKLDYAINDYGYDLSAEVYRLLFQLITGEEPAPVTWVWVEKSAPYDVRVWEQGESWRRTGQAKLTEALRVYEQCTATGVWPGVDEDVESGIHVSEAPSWLVARTDGTDDMEGF